MRNGYADWISLILIFSLVHALTNIYWISVAYWHYCIWQFSVKINISTIFIKYIWHNSFTAGIFFPKIFFRMWQLMLTISGPYSLKFPVSWISYVEVVSKAVQKIQVPKVGTKNVQLSKRARQERFALFWLRIVKLHSMLNWSKYSQSNPQK